jgi:hypothetical protein
MSVHDFFRYLSDDERTAALAAQLADAYSFRTGVVTPPATSAAAR